MKKKMIWLLLMIIICSVMGVKILIPSNKTIEVTDISIGDYIEIGSYLNKTIIWRVIHIDEEGDPLLLSNDIISFKSYDSTGEAHRNMIDEVNMNFGDTERIYKGSNLWEESNLRQWLNSDSKSIDWIRNPPSEGSKHGYLLPYDKEAGFLYKNNFTSAESNVIKQASYKVILNENDLSRSEGGDELYIFNEMINHDNDNYEKAYYQILEDKVFLLSTNEVKQYVYDREWDIKAKYSKKAYKKQAYPDGGWYKWNTFPDFYLLRTPSPNKDFASGVICVTLFKPKDLARELEETNASISTGVRPAMYLDLSKVSLSKGKGSLSKPYKIEE